MKKLNWLVLMIFPIAIFSCSDDEGGVLDTQDPMITFSTPIEGQTFSYVDGEEFLIDVNFQVTDDFGLDEVSIWATPPGGMRAMVESWGVSDFLNDDTEFDREYALRIGTPQAGNYLIEVEARDNQGNIGKNQVTVSVSQAMETSISLEGVEAGGTYTIGSSNEVSYMIMDGAGVDSVQILLVMEEDTLANQWYGEDYFSENVENNMDFTITDQLTIPNSAQAGAHMLIVNTYRDGAVVNSEETEITSEADPNARMVNFNVTPPAGFDTNSRLYVAGNFQGGDVYVNDYDQGYELYYDATTGTYRRAIYANPDQDFNYRYSTMDVEGNRFMEVDAECEEMGEGVYNRNYIYADGDTNADGMDDINDVDVNFTGFGGC